MTKRLEVGVLRLRIGGGSGNSSGFGADCFLRFRLRGWSWSWRLGNSDRGNWRRRRRSGLDLALCRSDILWRNIHRALIVRALLIHSLQLALQLALTLFGRFELSTLGFHRGLLFLGQSSSFFLATLLLLLLDLALADLFFKSLQASLLSILLLLVFGFALSGLVPTIESAETLK